MAPSGGSSPTDLTGLVGWVADVVSTLGPIGVGLLVALENLFPPMPSEVILPFAGFVASQGKAGLVTMVTAATAGSVGGAIVLYELGRAVGRDRVEQFLLRLPLVEERDVHQAAAWFHRHGQLAVFTGRFLPFVRSAVSLPAGADRVPRGRFLLLTALGSALWNAVWIAAGYVVGRQWQQVGRYSDWLNWTLAAAVAVAVARFLWKRRDHLDPDP